jgi:hypothetical protein
LAPNTAYAALNFSTNESIENVTACQSGDP